MFEAFDESNVSEHLAAFADGELSVEQRIAVLTYIADHPESLEVMRDQQRLRAAARRVLLASAPPVPLDLRERLQRLPLSEASTSRTSEGSFGNRSRQTWGIRSFGGPWAVAATLLLLLGIGVGSLLPTLMKHGQKENSSTGSAVSASLVSDVTKVHVDCSRFAPALHSAPFPLAPPFDVLAKAVKRDFKRQIPCPDLTSIGYAFVGAGPCRKPLDKTVHLLYRSLKLNVRDTLSIFVQPYFGQVSLQPEVMVAVAGPDAAHPMFVWRTADAVYLLVTDDVRTAEQARDTIQLAMAKPLAD